jgi:hypothetical protein
MRLGLKLDMRHRRHRVCKLGTAKGTVQNGDMERVDHVFPMLQPIARDDRGPATANGGIVRLYKFPLIHRLKTIVTCQDRLLIRGAHVSEDQPVPFLYGVPRLSDLVLELATVGFAGLLQAMAFVIKKPTVIAAAESAFFHLGIIERRAAVAAARVQESGIALPVAI